MKILDALVVGAGPTGLTLASELIRRGLRVRIIDKSPAATTLSKAIAVHARTLEIMDDMGVASDLISRGVKLIGASMSAGGESIAEVDFGGLVTRFPFILSVSQKETERVLGDLVKKHGGTIERAVELTAITQDADGVDATLRNADGREEKVRTSWLFGCDGAHSVVRKAIGATFEGHAYDDVFVLADVKVDWDAPRDRISTFFAEDGIAACFPMKDDRWRVIITATPDTKSDPTLDAVQAIMRMRTKKSVTLSDSAWISAFHISCRQVDRYRVGRVFLSGDAAHIHSPAGGQGMNTGIQDAHNLAWKVALVTAGVGTDLLLESYGAERHAIGKVLLRATDTATRIGTLHNSLQMSVRNHVIRFITSFDPIRRLLASEIAELNVGYAGSPIAKDQLHATAVRIGHAASSEIPTFGSSIEFRAGPKAGSRAPDGRVTRAGKSTPLSSILSGDAFTLLLFDGQGATTPGYETLARIAHKTRKKCGNHVRSFVVTPQRTRPAAIPDDIDVLIDEGELETHYASRTECIYLVRPDLYIAFRSQPADAAALDAYLGSIFV
jgi:2-polyprenyl-6-methoxyphenol hydroxylase-like FAD-dependent oxidoreductase